ncbi:MAG: DsrE family protein [Nitriliruptorales bacterium]|nr:DsrE family protein [Nitriliruptorales bacterium]
MEDERLLFPCSHGADEPERATIPFIAAATAAVSGHNAAVVCTVDAVWTGTPGHAETIEAEGLPPLEDLVRQLVTHGGEIWLCSSCTTRRGITADDLREGAHIVGAATIVDALAHGRAITLS